MIRSKISNVLISFRNDIHWNMFKICYLSYIEYAKLLNFQFVTKLWTINEVDRGNWSWPVPAKESLIYRKLSVMNLYGLDIIRHLLVQSQQ